jgi:tRNA(Arg) A34 adenosine deaminase TadA
MVNQFMKRAVELSRENMQRGQGGPFGAVIVKNGQIIAEGWNKVTSINDPTAHAEVTAIRKACEALNTFDLQGCEIYTSCEPCPMCLAAIYWARLEKIYYANTRVDAANIDFDDEFLYQELQKPLDRRTIPTIQIDRAEALPVFEEWRNKTDKIPY